MPLQKLKKNRLIFVYFLIILAFVIIISRMFHLAIFGDKVKIRGIYDFKKINRRANIVDRNGILVATDLKTKSLYISTILIKNPKSIARGLAKIFDDVSYKEILRKINSGKKKRDWILLKRNVTPNQVRKVTNLKKAGLIFENDSVRAYPQRSILSHLVGFVDLDRKGLGGIERKYNKQLASGKKDLKLGVDVRIQDVLSDELQKGMAQFKAKAASGIILDVTNGEVLALSSLPSFDANLQFKASPNQRFNRITNGVYELGSIFKIFTNAIAFDEDLVKKGEVFEVSKPIKYGRFTIDDDHKDKDELSLEDVFAKSSNIGTVQIAQRIGVKKQREYFKKLGFLKKVETDFVGLGRPIYPRKWREINLFTISYGHGIAVTPLHLAVAAAASINGGILYKPSFAKLKAKPKGERIFKKSTSDFMRKMLRKVAVDGTGRKANIEGYEVGGKTGTAEKAQGGSYNEKQTIASFMAVFPMSSPKYLVYVIFDSPNARFNTGGMVAAPVAGRVVKNIAPILEVLPR